MKLDKIFTSHMVFAAHKPIRIYGSGKGEAKVIFNGEERKVISASDSWLTEFPPMHYSGPYELKLISNGEETILSDIYIGEVYVYAGQSNIEMKLKDTNFNENYEDISNLRMFFVDKISFKSHFCIDDGWLNCKGDDSGEWPAIAYLSGRKIVKDKNIAVGVISCCMGASIIESWVPKDTFKNIGIDIPDDQKMVDHTQEMYKSWNIDGILYEQQLLKLVPFNVSAIIWYQGESDVAFPEACVYDRELCALIDIWRSDFKNDKLPFVIVQLANSTYTRAPQAWRLIQDAQYNVQKMRENVTTVICADICENYDIHPKSKEELSNRIALKLMEM